MRIFLTGGTGYIGGALARRLAAAGHELRALVRPTSNVEKLQEIGAATFAGDITDRDSMREAMSGADWVIHAAADRRSLRSSSRASPATGPSTTPAPAPPRTLDEGLPGTVEYLLRT